MKAFFRRPATASQLLYCGRSSLPETRIFVPTSLRDLFSRSQAAAAMRACRTLRKKP